MIPLRTAINHITIRKKFPQNFQLLPIPSILERQVESHVEEAGTMCASALPAPKWPVFSSAHRFILRSVRRKRFKLRKKICICGPSGVKWKVTAKECKYFFSARKCLQFPYNIYNIPFATDWLNWNMIEGVVHRSLIKSSPLQTQFPRINYRQTDLRPLRHW